MARLGAGHPVVASDRLSRYSDPEFAGEGADQGQIDAARSYLGLDRPLPQQYLTYAGRVLRGDLGTSFAQRRPVTEVIALRLPATILLTGTALALSTVGGLALGLFGGGGALAGKLPFRGRLLRRILIELFRLESLPALHASRPFERRAPGGHRALVEVAVVGLAGGLRLARGRRSGVLFLRRFGFRGSMQAVTFAVVGSGFVRSDSTPDRSATAGAPAEGAAASPWPSAVAAGSSASSSCCCWR